MPAARQLIAKKLGAVTPYRRVGDDIRNDLAH
jgi:hypothetical protein